jgi:hypothetical protein
LSTTWNKFDDNDKNGIVLAIAHVIGFSEMEMDHLSDCGELLARVLESHARTQTSLHVQRVVMRVCIRADENNVIMSPRQP